MHHPNSYLHMKQTCSVSRAAERKLHTAIEHGSLADVEKELTCGASVNCIINGLTPTAHAIISEQHDIALELIQKHQADIHQGQQKRFHHHQLHHHYGVIDHKRNSNHVPLLILAVRHGFLDGVKLLLERGAEIDATDDVSNETALHLAVTSGKIEMVSLLLKHHPNVNCLDIESRAPIHLAVKLNYAVIIGYLLNAGASVNLPGPLDQLPLHIACTESSTEEMVKLLLQARSAVNVPDCLNMTPLHYAAKAGDLSVVRMLIQHQADASLQDHVLDTPLHKAVENGHTHVVEELLRQGHGDPNAESGQGPMRKLPLQTAAATGFTELVDKLLEYGADINQRDSVYDETALHWAVQRGDVKMTEHLIYQGAEVNHHDSHGSQSPLYITCMRDNGEESHVQIAKLLLQHGADINYIPYGYQHHHYGAALHIVASRGLLKMAKTLVMHPETDLNILNWDEQTALRVAIKQDDQDMARILVNAGCDINNIRHKKTDLEYAMCLGSYATAGLLIQHGADLHSSKFIFPSFSHLQMLFRSESISVIAKTSDITSLVRILIAAGEKFPSRYGFKSLLFKVIQNKEIPLGNILQNADPAQPFSLFCSTVIVIRKQLRKAAANLSILGRIKQLPLPNLMKDELFLHCI